MSKAIYHKIWLYKHIRINLDDHAALLLFKTMLLPYFDYRCIFLTTLPVTCFQRLQIYCNIVLWICFKFRDPTDCPVKQL